MKRPAIAIVLSLAVVWPPSSPCAAGFIATTDGNRIPCPVMGMIWNRAVAETSLAITQFKSTDSESGRLRAYRSTQSTEASRVKGDLPKVDESLSGTEYVNRTGKFALTLPAQWIINPDLRHRPDTLAGLSSSDKTRFAVVVQTEYPGSLDSYKELAMAATKITLNNFEELSRSSTTIDGREAIVVFYRGSLPAPANSSVEFVTAFIRRSEHNFAKITAWCAEPLFRDMQPSLKKLVTSYRSSNPSIGDSNR